MSSDGWNRSRQVRVGRKKCKVATGLLTPQFARIAAPGTVDRNVVAEQDHLPNAAAEQSESWWKYSSEAPQEMTCSSVDGAFVRCGRRSVHEDETPSRAIGRWPIDTVYPRNPVADDSG